jgi:hypothetical protein
MEYLDSSIHDNLINPVVLDKFNVMAECKTPSVFYERCMYCYDEYIRPNIFFILFVIILCCILIYRYNTKQDNFVPSFLPNIPIDQQISYTNYMPDQLPMMDNNSYFNDIDHKYNEIYNAKKPEIEQDNEDINDDRDIDNMLGRSEHLYNQVDNNDNYDFDPRSSLQYAMY